jgi:hypothetical protein
MASLSEVADSRQGAKTIFRFPVKFRRLSSSKGVNGKRPDTKRKQERMKHSMLITTFHAALLLASPSLWAQPTAFTYQGFLHEGSAPAQGAYDLRFALYDDGSGGSAVAGPVTNAAVAVSNGLFTVLLDFGSGIFNGAARWLDIGVRPQGTPGDFTPLTPRQPVTATPYALHALTAAAVPVGLDNTSSGFAATVSGGQSNWSDGDWSTIGGGEGNTTLNWWATVGGGRQNENSGDSGTIAGGEANTLSGAVASIGGGSGNYCPGYFATIGGGLRNTNGGDGAVIPGGTWNTAVGQFSFAAGRGAQARHRGAFVWADGSDSSQVAWDPVTRPFASTAPNEFSVRATGGVRLVSAIDTNGTPCAGVTLAPGSGAWSSLSDRHAKENLRPVDTRAVLDKLAALPLATWNYRSQPAEIHHLGPMAQDFQAAFGLGENDRSIATVDADGVALAAIQGLNQKLETRRQQSEARSQKLEAENAELKRELGELKSLVSTLSQKLNGGAQ